MNDEEKTLRQLLYTSEQLNREFSKQRQGQAFSRKLCQLGANLKREKDDIPNPLADDCFTAAMEFVSMSNLVKHCQESERKAYLELQQIANILETTVDNLPRVAAKLSDDSRKRDFCPHNLLNMDSRTHNMVILAADTYGCVTLTAIANLADENFLALRNCGLKTLQAIRTAFSLESNFEDIEGDKEIP